MRIEPTIRFPNVGRSILVFVAALAVAGLAACPEATPELQRGPFTFDVTQPPGPQPPPAQPPAPPPTAVLTGLSISPASITFSDLAERRQLEVTGTFSDGSQEDLAASDTGTTYRTSEPAIATVTAEGLVAPVTDGQAVVTATSGGFSATVAVTVAASVPRDPAHVAPPVDPTVATTMFAATEFLYTGDNPIQTGVAPGAIEPRRVAVLRGRVTDRGGEPIPGVAVTILNHPEFGRTGTRADGMFDLAVSGGGLLCLNFAKAGFLTGQRQVDVPWQDYVHLPETVLVPRDTQVTTVDLDASDPIQVARGSVSIDNDGARQPTLFFSQGTQAELVLADGTTQPISSLNVRVTEYTVGDSGPAAMPARLPPTSAYTYCVEFSVDEADSAGATDVRFTQPVIHYVENFLGFPVGGVVPYGYYDRQQGVWVAAENGRVIEVLSVTAGLADLDLDGDGLAADAAALAALGITDQERERLAVLYQPGQTLWRVPISHFSPGDCNWPGPSREQIVSAAAEDRKHPPPKRDRPRDDPCEEEGSIVEIQNQILGERIAVTGTPFTLNYRSDRVRGRTAARTLDIPLTGDSVSSILPGITLQVEIAGRLFSGVFPPQPNLIHTFTWDGLDAYGRRLEGVLSVRIRIGYAYPSGPYLLPGPWEQAFGRFGEDPLGISTRVPKRPVFQRYVTTVGTMRARGAGLGAWTLTTHHAYDPVGRVLHRGDGTRRSVDSLPLVIATVAGRDTTGFSGDGGPATEAELDYPQALAVGPDGSIYIADTRNERIRRVDPDGIITTVAGGGSIIGGDGLPATDVYLSWTKALAIGPDGSLYIGTQSQGVRRVDPDGIITTIPAGLLASGLAVAPDGSLFVADSRSGFFGGQRVYQVGTDGIVTTVAGTGIALGGFSGDGGPATEARLSSPRGLAIGPDGSLYIADSGNGVIRRVGTDGIITTVAGDNSCHPNCGFGGDGGPATDARLYYPMDIAVGPDGTLFIADGNRRIRRVATNGIITTVAGSGNRMSSGDGGPAAKAGFAPWAVALGPDGSLYISDTYSSSPGGTVQARIRRVFQPLPGFDAGEIAIPSADGSELFQFDGVGRHLRTLSTLTGVVLYEFTYDGDGYLSRIQDGNGNLTTIERDASGNPSAIVAPFGQRTTVGVDGNGFLDQIGNPAGETVHFTYTPDGLLLSLTDAKGNTSLFSYDPLGRLIRDQDPAGGFLELARSDDQTGYTVTVTTALGRVATHRVESLSTDEVRLLNTDPNGASTEVLIGADGSRVVTYPDGVTKTWVLAPDPRWGMLAPFIETLSVQTPGALELTVATQRAVTLADPDDLLSLLTETETLAVNGRTSTRTFDSATGTITLLSPAGRQRTAWLDARGRVVEMQLAAGLDPFMVTYDSAGKVTDLRQGTQVLTLEYDTAGRVVARRNALGHELRLSYDDADRLIGMLTPGGRTFGFTYDASCCNRTQVAMPSGAVHELAFTALNQFAGYTPPGAGMLSRAYNLDRQRVRTTLPSGREQEVGYDPGGRPTGITYPEAAVSFDFFGMTRQLTAITRTPTGGGPPQMVGYAYDGNLPTEILFQGSAQGTYTYQYDSDLRPVGIRLDGGPVLAIQRDDDGLVTTYGPFTIARGAAGLPDTLSDGNLEVAYVFTGSGRVAQRTHTVAGNVVYDLVITYDDAGRLVQRLETVAGTTHTYDYTYTPDGHLIEVTRDGTADETYGYDLNGNRTRAGSTTASYDDQDRLIQHDGVPYGFDADGFLSGRGADTFVYSARGELLSATVANETITYACDGFGRRVARTDNAGTTQYLYGEPGNPFLVSATRAPDGTLTTYFHDEAGLLVAFERGGQRFYVAVDQVGSPRLVIDSAGAVVKRIDYDSFGEVTSATNPGFDLAVGFAGGLSDLVTESSGSDSGTTTQPPGAGRRGIRRSIRVARRTSMCMSAMTRSVAATRRDSSASAVRYIGGSALA
jgi:YD repeat-containing protein